MGTVVANQHPGPDAIGGSDWPGPEALERGNPDTGGSGETDLAKLERAQQGPRRLLATGLLHGGQTKVGQLQGTEATAPANLAAAPHAPATNAHPGDAVAPHAPVLASEKGGSVLVRQGACRAHWLTVAERLAEAGPENADRQRDLAVAFWYNKAICGLDWKAIVLPSQLPNISPGPIPAALACKATSPCRSSVDR